MFANSAPLWSQRKLSLLSLLRVQLITKLSHNLSETLNHSESLTIANAFCNRKAHWPDWTNGIRKSSFPAPKPESVQRAKEKQCPESSSMPACAQRPRLALVFALTCKPAHTDTHTKQTRKILKSLAFSCSKHHFPSLYFYLFTSPPRFETSAPAPFITHKNVEHTARGRTNHECVNTGTSNC